MPKTNKKHTRLTAEQKVEVMKDWNGKAKDIPRIEKKYKISGKNLWLWKKRYDGTVESMENRFCTEHQRTHAKSHSQQEIEWIEEAIKNNPNCGRIELFSILRNQHGYNKSIDGFDRFLKKNGYYEGVRKVNKFKTKDEAEPRPKQIDKKYFFRHMQMDVRKLPRELCTLGEDKEIYLYHMVDEGTSERFSYAYEDAAEANSIDFLKRAIEHYGYTPIQIKNEAIGEFADYITNRQGQAFKKFCFSLEIVPLFVRQNDLPLLRRCHRTDYENFYPYLTYSSLAELIKQISDYINRTNSTVSTTLKTKVFGKIKLLTPLEQKAMILTGTK